MTTTHNESTQKIYGDRGRQEYHMFMLYVEFETSPIHPTASFYHRQIKRHQHIQQSPPVKLPSPNPQSPSHSGPNGHQLHKRRSPQIRILNFLIQYVSQNSLSFVFAFAVVRYFTQSCSSSSYKGVRNSGCLS